MDSVFFLSEDDRANFIQKMLQSCGCTYICLWSYDPSSNCLRYTDGFYHERSNQPSSSSGTINCQRLFNEYSQSIIIVDGSVIPGLAFLSKNPHMDLQSIDLQRLASTPIQRQFYQEARIKNSLFMGCHTGEVELGFSYDSSQDNLEMEMRTWFSEDFSGQLAPSTRELSQPSTDQNRPASSSSSLRSLSYDSPEYSPILFNIPSASYLVPEQQQQAMVQQALGSAQSAPTMSTTPHQQAIRTLSQIRNVELPAIESEDAAMTRAILAVISTPPSTSSALQSQQQNLRPNYPIRGSQRSAFRWYRSDLAPGRPTSSRTGRQNMLKRSFAFLSSLYSLRTQGQVGRTSSTQLHHMISERRRREKLNESFQTLRSLLPPGTKKDKASVLASTTEHLKSLKTQVDELRKRIQLLEAQLLPQKSAAEETFTGSSNERVEVQLTNVAASTSTSTARYVDLQVTVREDVSMADLVVSLLEFLKTDRNVNLISVEADTRVADTTLVNNVIMRLRIEDGEWDESAFRETIRRVVNDLAEKP